ncbi:MAG: hypothetical protein WDM90_08055 [Ferruginibacter sp.]
MKQLSTKILAISALVIAGFSATAQSNGQRSMTKRGAGNQQASAAQSDVTYSNGNQGSQNDNRNNQYSSGNNSNRTGQYNNNDSHAGQYAAGNNNAQYGNRNQSFGGNNRREQSGRHDASFSKRRPLLSIFFGYRKDYRRDDYNRGRERRHFDRNRRW